MLRLLAEAGTLTLSDIGRTVGLSPSSCLNLLKTLVGEGAVERDARTKYYRLAPAWQAVEVLRSEEHTSELQSLMRISYAVFCLKKKKYTNTHRLQPLSRQQTTHIN